MQTGIELSTDESSAELNSNSVLAEFEALLEEQWQPNMNLLVADSTVLLQVQVKCIKTAAVIFCTVLHLDYMTVTSDSGLFGGFFFFSFLQRKVSVEGSHEARDI